MRAAVYKALRLLGWRRAPGRLREGLRGGHAGTVRGAGCGGTRGRQCGLFEFRCSARGLEVPRVFDHAGSQAALVRTRPSTE